MPQIVIVGNGIAGITAARHIRKGSTHPILVISDEAPYFFSRTALMYVYMGHMRFQDTQPYENNFWKKNNIDLRRDRVTQIHTSQKKLQLKSGEQLSYDQLILAVGSLPNRLHCPGQQLKGVQGFYSLQDLQQLEDNTPRTERAVIVGGGLIGVELAEMMRSRGIEVTFLVRESTFWGDVLPREEGHLIAQHIAAHRIDLRLNTELSAILDDGNGSVAAVQTQTGETIPCQLVGLAVGVSPNVAFVRSSAIAVDRGIEVNAYLETNVPDVYAVGDCAQFQHPADGRSAIEQTWYTGRIMGETVAQTLLNNRTAYRPGPWFNAAKFFDIEYQTYGRVPPQPLPPTATFYWEHPSAKQALRLVWDSTSEVFQGIDVLGMRMRHQLFDQWLRERATVDTVMRQLPAANFDPELYRRHEGEIMRQFNAATGKQLTLKPKKWWRNSFSRTPTNN